MESYEQEPNREEKVKEESGGIKEETQTVSSEPATLVKQEKADESYPESYGTNSPDEVRLLNMAHNFQRQFSHLYPERRPLLLCPFNECGVKKFVSTTLRPSPINHPELFTWEGCARFLADFLSLVPLDPPEDLPRMISSSSTVLRTQTATCFEFASVLCSLLIGAHYDAYCVSGYAVREMCLLDQSLQQCPLLDTPVKRETPAEEPQENKYAVRPKRELKSRFLLQQEKKKQEEEAEQPQEVERRPADPLRGLRRHCWVLVLSGRRDIQETFFIDPLTGNRYPTNDDNFLGVDSVWNDLNYYANMQDCRDGCANMVYDLDDINLWEPVLFGARSKKQLIQEVEIWRKGKQTSVRAGEEEEPRVFEMPTSWVSCINISKKDLEDRFPEKKKTTLYRRAKLERFAVYLRKDGLVTRLTTYKDLDRSEEVGVKEWYQHRKDNLEEREVDRVNSVTTERFRHGRRFHFLVHRYTDTEHCMEFNRAARVDNLVRRVETIGEMTEFFEGRRDFLYYRHVVMDRHALSSEQDLVTDRDNQWIQKVVERFHRNTSKPAMEDVAERVFLLAQRQIEVKYHVEDNRVIPSRRRFIKPREGTEKEKAEDFRADMVSSFMMDPFVKPLSTLTLYELLKALMSAEEETVLKITQSVKEMRDIVVCRKQEEESVELLLSPWTTAGAAKARRLRQEMERLAAEEQRWLQQQKNDILAPFLIKLNNPTTLTCSEAQQLHQECLTDLKERLVEQANLIQERYEKVTQELQKKQQWYQKNQPTITDEEETDYQAYCFEKTLQIQVTKKRLEMHKEAASQKYSSLDKTLREDPRLAPHLKS